MNEQSKLNQLLGECKKNVGNHIALYIGVKEAKLEGPVPQSVAPSSAIVLQKQNGSVFVKGILDAVYSEYSSENKLISNKIIVGADCRKGDNIKIYYDFGAGEEKVTSKTEMAKDDMLLVYWEIEQISCLTFCSYDGVRNEIIREILTAKEEPMKKLLRGITRQFLSLLKSDIQPNMNDDPHGMELSSNE